MSDQNDIMGSLESIKSLGGFLKSEMSITQTDEDNAEIVIKVQNTAPESSLGGDVVFTGVGLRIIDGRIQTKSKIGFTSSVNIVGTIYENNEARQKHQQGVWIQGEAFPAITQNEGTFGEVLFAGEGRTYKLRVSKNDLQYLDIRVEGQLSRRHLFHFIEPMGELKARRNPLIKQTMKSLDSINLYRPLIEMVDKIPDLGPETTLSSIDKIRLQVSSMIDHINQSTQGLNDIFRSSPNQEFRDYISLFIVKYVNSVRKACENTMGALSGSDTTNMENALEEMKKQVSTWDEVESKRRELLSTFGIDLDE